MSLLKHFKRTKQIGQDPPSPRLEPEIHIITPPPPPTGISSDKSVNDMVDQAKEVSTQLIELARQFKEVLQHAKKMVSSCSESRSRVHRLTTINEEGGLLLNKLEGRLKSLQRPTGDISQISLEFKILFESMKIETTGAAAAFDDFFQVAFDLDQSVTKTTDLLMIEAKAMQLLKKSIQSIPENHFSEISEEASKK